MNTIISVDQSLDMTGVLNPKGSRYDKEYWKIAALTCESLHHWGGKPEDFVDFMSLSSDKDRAKAINMFVEIDRKLIGWLDSTREVHINHIRSLVEQDNALNHKLAEYLVNEFKENNDRTGWYSLPLSKVFPMYLSLASKMPYLGVKRESDTLSGLYENEAPFIGETRVELALPDIQSMSWEDILELRENPYIDQYRKFIYGRENDYVTREELMTEVNEELWELMAQIRPSMGGSTLSRVIANLPIPAPVPLPNPYAIWKDYKEGSKEKEMAKKFGHLFFFAEVREKNKGRS